MLDEVINISLQTRRQTPAIEFTDGEILSDEILVQSVLAGDDAAYAEIFDRYKKMVTRVVGRFFRERSDIEEFVQQSFTKAYFSLKKYRGGEERSFAAWMTRIAVNVCYDEFRRRKRKGERVFTEMDGDEDAYVKSIVDNRSRSPERSITAAQLAEKVLDSLSTEDRIAMTLVYSEDYPLEEVAAAIGVTTSNLKSRLFRIRISIRKRFGHLFA